MKYLVFDIETRIDKGLVRSVYHPGQAISDEEAYERVRERLQREQGSDFFPVTFHVPIVVALGEVADDGTLARVDALGGADTAAQLTRTFWQQVEECTGVLVSFNGRGFDLPVMELQALRHGIDAPRYFTDRYGPRNRFSDKHLDLHDFLSNAGAVRLRGGLDVVSRLIGLPGKTEISGRDVQRLWERGEVGSVERYCRRDVIQTYLVLLRVERLRGRIGAADLQRLWAAAEPWRREVELV
jgi:hypothetical protein